MKTSLLAFFVFCFFSTYASNYYFSSSLGDDNRTALQAQDPSTPWKTLNQLNSFFSNLQAGDAVLFQRGDVFYGSVKVSKSGTSASRIVFDAYGSGAAPEITGLTTVGSWQNLGNNIWESSSAVSAMPATNMVLVNGVNTPMGRYPNSGYLTYETFSGNTSITSSGINSNTTNWTGAEAVIKKNKWILDRGLITSHSGGTLVYSGGGYVGRNKFGFFIQNDARTLDQQNEWYYNPSTKKLRIYSTGTPVNVQLSTIDTLIYMTYCNYITFNNISFTGANGNAFLIGSCSNLIIQGCKIGFCYNGINGKNFGTSSANFILQNCAINQSNNNAVYLSDEFSGAALTNNAINNTAMIPGAGGSGDGTYNAINLQGSNSIIKYNTVDTVGYNGITFYGNSVNVSYNKVNNFCVIKSDGGGIYTRGINADMLIAGNIVINGIGNVEGVYNPTGVGVIGIYCDGTVTDIQVLNNSVANINNAGIYLHNPVNLEIRNNTVYNCTYTGFLVKNDDSSIYVRNLSVTNNIFLSKGPVQLASKLITLHNDISNWGNIDSNYYARPIDDNSVFAAQPFGENGITNNYNLTQWKSYSLLDAHSLKSPKTITNTGDLRFEYNAALTNKVISLDANYIDVTGKSYPGTITLAPYSSAALIKNGAIVNQPPTVNITSPVNNTTFTSPASITITASAADDGSIAKVDFYSGSTLIGTVNSSPYSFTWNNGSAGNYSLTAKATDNAGLAATSSVVLVSVSATAKLIPPVINMTSPGNNTTYNNPATVNMSASASDADGSISKVEFFNGSTLLGSLISSPYNFTWANVPAGIYSLTAVATDNDGLTATSAVVSVLVTTSAAPIINITTPKNNTTYKDPATIMISATASDANGSISKVEFFNGSTLLNIGYIPPYNFSWNYIRVGNYSLTVRATDNDGLTTTSAVVFVSVTASGVSGGAPVVSITSPKTNATYKDPATITMSAAASDANGSISKVEFFNGATLLSTQLSSPYSFTWKNVHKGNYSLTAKATDNAGLTTKSAAVSVSVTNGAPVVNITAPKNNASFNKSATITLSAAASDANGSISKVEFFKGSTLLSTLRASPYSFNWKNVPVGNYTVTAKATDNSGLATTSAPVHISVKTPTALRSSSTQDSLSAPSVDSESVSISLPGINNDPDKKESGNFLEPVLSKFVSFRLLPNPAVNTIQLYFDGLQAYQKSNLTIYNAFGALLKKYPVIISGKKIDVDISSLHTGIYFIGLSGDSFSVNKKFIKVN